MTLILTIGNQRQVIQFSDRRLSSLGEVVDDQSNKATILTCLNGRFSVGFTGLARASDFEFQPWLVEALGECGPPDYGIYEIAQRLRGRLTRLFATDPRLRVLSPRDRRLTLMLSGYVYNQLPGRVGTLLITNFQDFGLADRAVAADDFWMHRELEMEHPLEAVTYVQRVGAWPAMTPPDEAILRDLLRQDASTDVLTNAGVGLIRAIASRPAAAGTVGDDVMAVVLPRDPTLPTTSAFRHARAVDEIVLADQVVCLPDSTMMIRDFRVSSAAPDGVPGFKPKLGRNERCWCGSGKKFKRCHGR